VLIATPVSAGYVSAPAQAAVAGDYRRTRVFIDGVEYDSLDPHANGLVDLSQIQLWPAEDVTIEQAATEVRVHIRTWRVNNTSSYTRLDIGTGDQQLNTYRGFYGKRFSNGGAVQLAAQEYATTPPSYLGESADQLGVVGRVGWAGSRLSIDAFGTHVGQHRGEIRAFGRVDSLPTHQATRSDAYVRVGYNDTDTSTAWAQIVASRSWYTFTGDSLTHQDTSKHDHDTTFIRNQVVASLGANRGALHLTAIGRFRSDTVSLFTPALTASWSQGPFGLRANLEGKSADSLSRADVVGEWAILPRAHIGAAVDQSLDHLLPTAPRRVGGRAWAGVKVAGLWIDGGAIHRDSAALVSPSLLGDTTGTVLDPPATGLTLRIHGQLYKALFADVNALRWNDTAALYRPQYQTRSEVYLSTSLPDRFPDGVFGMLLSVRHEYRSASLVPNPASAVFLRAQGERAVSALLEFRIYGAVVSWQARNIIGTRNYQAPNYLMPRTTNFYGVRWEFWN
jgi:hypothetical protein